ncbi:MAG TPA: ribbon-helix-helix domain-containing protein, partial [Tepidisphaeraceae bacterium]|nr:ribbon-helix-helix domain-containing protein [Tepidisphaeraceae bacterium]
MKSSKVAVSMESGLLRQLDRLVQSRVFESRSQAVQVAVEEKLARLKKTRLAAECAKLDKAAEQAMADEGLTRDLEEW